MYYALAGDADNGGTLNVVGFNGTAFVGGVTQLEFLVPDWNAMSLGFAPEVIPEPSLLALFGVGLAARVVTRRRREASRFPPSVDRDAAPPPPHDN